MDSEELPDSPTVSMKNEEEITSNSKSSDEGLFKKPMFIGKLPKFNKSKSSLTKSNANTNINVEIQIGVKKDPKDENLQAPIVKKSPAQQIAEKSCVFPYKEPTWSGLPKHEYYLEILKGGIIVDTIQLVKPFVVFGRHSQCDIVMEHPSISRFHCVIQYRYEASENEPTGYYIYDLESTHGTYLNRLQLKPRCYQRIHVGHFIKVGGSSRMYILQGPALDEEPESELTVTELLNKANEKKAQMEDNKEDVEKDGISWGMGEDAVNDEKEDEEEGGTEEEMISLLSSEELFLDDPKKTLRGWFEREGYDLPNYEATEIGPGNFRCKVELPIETANGQSIIASVDHRGKKKDCVIQCALEACRILNKHGVLRQAKHESHKKKKKNWSENDYYDSDEDEFWDRTGDVQKKRHKRMKQDGVEESQVLTYEALKEQYDKAIKELELLEKRLESIERLKQQQQDASEERQYTSGTAADELDAYMERLKSQVPDKHKRVQWKLRIVELKKEELQLRKLVNVARPPDTPELTPYAGLSDTQVSKSNTEKMTGKKLPLNKFPSKQTTSLNQPRILGTHKAFLEEEPEQKLKLSRLTDPGDLKPVPYSKQEEKITLPRFKSQPKPVEMSDLMKPYEHKNSLFKHDKQDKNDTEKNITTLTLKEDKPIVENKSDSPRKEESVSDVKSPDDLVLGHTNNTIDDKLSSNNECVKKNERKRVMGPTLPSSFDFDKKRKPTKTLEGLEKKKDKPYKVFDSSYETWTPPSNQTGDGRTKLNEKYGY